MLTLAFNVKGSLKRSVGLRLDVQTLLPTQNRSTIFTGTTSQGFSSPRQVHKPAGYAMPELGLDICGEVW